MLLFFFVVFVVFLGLHTDTCDRADYHHYVRINLIDRGRLDTLADY